MSNDRVSNAMSPGPSYPSPTAAQVGAGAAPFYGQNGGSPSQIPTDLQRLQQADLGQEAAMMLSTPTNDVQHYTENDIPMDASMTEPTSQERMAQGVLSLDHGDVGPSSAARKRSKVSRACDECRRKKIRCDATSDNLEEPCSSCRRTNVPCRFSRQPMKRGPSKGYIKELADRLNSLESQLNPNVHMNQPDASYMQPGSLDPGRQRLGDQQDFSTPPQAHMSRKRTFSMSERGSTSRERDVARGATDQLSALDMLMNLYPGAQRGGTRGGSVAGMGDLAGYFRSDSPPKDGESSLAGQEKPLSPGASGFSRSSALPDAGRGESLGLQYEAAMREDDPSIPADLKEYDASFDEYYRLIHPTFPLLPHSKSRLYSRLNQAPHTLRAAFCVALDCAVRTSPSSRLKVNPESRANSRVAAELISSSQYEDASSRTLASNILYIQTLTLMTLESDNHGPATSRGQLGPPRSEWLGRAIGMANHTKLNVPRFGESYAEDVDSDEKLGRRVWWILFILDRWNASSANSALLLPDNSSALLPDDQSVLGDTVYQLTRLSYILGHLATILQQPASLMAAGSIAAPIINLTLVGEVERFRESMESVLSGTPGLVHLAYWHVRLMIMRLTSSATPHELFAPASRIASMLNSPQTISSPLNHHFAALSALTLVELCEFEETRPAAERGIEDVVQALSPKRGLMAREDGTGWDSAIRELVTRKKTRATTPEPVRAIKQLALQQLADAAIGDNRRVPESPGTSAAGGGIGVEGMTAGAANKSPQDTLGSATFDATHLARFGYLAALA